MALRPARRLAAAVVSAGGRHAATAVPDAAVVEIALEALAHKLRGELVLGLLEELAAGQRSGRSVLAEFRRAEAALTGVQGGQPGQPGQHADRELRDLIDQLGDNPRNTTGRWSAAVQRALHGGPPEWERLRQVGRDNNRPVPEWEVFYGLHRLAAAEAGASTGAGAGPAVEAAVGHASASVTIEAIETAMDLQGSLGETWSLHHYLRETRARCGPQFRPGRPEEVAGMLLRVDAARQLILPGGYTLGVRTSASGPARVIGEATMRQLAESLRGPTLRSMAAGAGLEWLRGAPSVTGSGARLRQGEIGQALRAGAAIERDQRARAAAQRARERASELRGQRLASSSTVLYAAGAVSGSVLTISGLVSGVQGQLTTTIGIVMTTLSLAGNTVKDWASSTEAAAAPLRAWVAERVAAWTERTAAREVGELHRGRSAGSSPLDRARAALTTRRRDAISAAVDRWSPTLPRARPTPHPAPTPPRATPGR